MPPAPTVAITALAALVGAAVGLWLRARLDTLSYRHPDETERPRPGRRLWLPVVLGLAGAALTWRHLGLGHPEHLLFLLPTAGYSVAVAAIDLDVHRIPFKPTLAITAAAVVGLSAAALWQGEPAPLLRGALAGGIAYLGFWLLHRVSRGGVGRGDVRLAGLLGLTAGALSLSTAWWALAIALVTAAAWAIITQPAGRIAFAPWLSAGWLVAVVALAA